MYSQVSNNRDIIHKQAAIPLNLTANHPKQVFFDLISWE
jgi:hypothetical protein